MRQSKQMSMFPDSGFKNILFPFDMFPAKPATA